MNSLDILSIKDKCSHNFNKLFFVITLGVIFSFVITYSVDNFNLFQLTGVLLGICAFILFIGISINKIELGILIFITSLPILYLVSELIIRKFRFGLTFLMITPETVFLAFLFIAFLINLTKKKYKTISYISKNYTSIDFFMFILLFAGIISIISSPNINLSYKCFAKGIVEPIILYFILTRIISNKKQINIIIISIISSAFLLSCYLLFYHLKYINYLTPEEVEYFRFASGHFNPAISNTILIIAIPLAIGFLLSNSDKLVKTIIIFSIFVMIFTLFLSYSRGAWISLLISFLVLLKVKKFRIVFVPLISLFALLMFIEKIKNLIFLRQSIASGGIIDFLFDLDRWQGWISGLQMMIDHPITGIGMGMFKYKFPSYIISPNTFLVSSHNLFIDIGAELGVICFISFLMMTLTVLYLCIFKLTDQKIYKISLISSLLGYLVFMLTSGGGLVHYTPSFSNFINIHTFITFTLISLVVISHRNTNERRVKIS